MTTNRVKYKGVIYRINEARWAAWFDLVSVDAQYQQEWCNTMLSGSYPSFWLPKAKSWVAVACAVGEADRDKLLEWTESTDDPVFLCVGIPLPGNYNVELFGCAKKYPGIRKGLFAEHVSRRGLWLADNSLCAPMRKVFVRENVSRDQLIVHSGWIRESLRQAHQLFR